MLNNLPLEFEEIHNSVLEMRLNNLYFQEEEESNSPQLCPLGVGH